MWGEECQQRDAHRNRNDDEHQLNNNINNCLLLNFLVTLRSSGGSRGAAAYALSLKFILDTLILSFHSSI